MRKEDIKVEFFKQFGNQSFRGYPLEQCHSIWEFFEKYINNDECYKILNEERRDNKEY